MSYDVFVKCPGFSAEMFHGRSILEAGTGDNFGLALTFVAGGAKRVVTVDKFYSKRDPEQQRRIYQAMRERLDRSEEHTSELQSLAYLVCRLLLEKKKKNHSQYTSPS